MNNCLALFDFDGTLCKLDSFTGFMHYRFSKKHFYRKCLTISPYIAAYYAKLYPAHLMRPLLFKTLFQNTSHPISLNHGVAYADALYQQALNPDVLAKLRWHQAQQHHVVLVSASLDLYLIPLAQRLKTTLICTQTDYLEGQLTGLYLTPDCSRQQKEDRLKQCFDLQGYNKIYAYGNSIEDHAMLALATDPFWINKQHKIHHFSKK